MNIQRILTIFLIVSFGLSSSIAHAAIDMFLDFPDSDIVGESQDRDHMDEIEILAWSWVLSPERKTDVAVRDISLTKYVDSATPSFFMKAVAGDNLGRAVITVRRGGEKSEEFLIITLIDATLTSVSSAGNAGADRMSEQITFGFSSMSGEYIKFGKEGSGPVATYKWNIAVNMNGK